jgi:hypothetical protein
MLFGQLVIRDIRNQAFHDVPTNYHVTTPLVRRADYSFGSMTYDKVATVSRVLLTAANNLFYRIRPLPNLHFNQRQANYSRN